ncbi:cytochrome c oxidase accessory protein CcoG [Fulvitalea axinellae]|uniref:Cytochrome c oxidase accessory protein CcoG n=1 Tax=Fulvitalea axinellae TaxID=1182444 RepID=A0AAU9CP94_9BACT|nr:cytochrome c oxidase accessory protein CcoG [Fulvitalea axinellae]
MDADSIYELDQEFRDSIKTVDKDGKRIWLNPKKPFNERYHKARIWVSVLLLGLLFGTPFIKIDGHPFMLFNIFERKFILFGVPFWPQDFHILVLGAIAFIIFIVLFTVVFGRIWCGWACPQTIFMEMVFRKIEYWIEGDASKQKKLNNSPWTTEKIIKKASKQAIFVAISLLIAHTLMAYLVGLDKTIEIVSMPPSANLSGFIALLAFTGVFYWVFSYFREQACIAVCPYGRLQGVFLTKESIAVMYDWVRGEKRAKIRKNQDREQLGFGDCIDCNLCVHVCPTGIDIRNGTQLECVNCTACIDACDVVMRKTNKPEGLIRYASHDSIEKGKNKIFTARVKAYSVVLLLILSLLGYLLATRTDVETGFLRVPGMLYNKEDNGNISNLYNVKFVNKTFDPIDLSLKVLNEPDAIIRRVGSTGEGIHIDANALEEGIFFVELPPKSIKSIKTKLVIGVFENGKQIETVKTNFVGPVSGK